MMRTLLIALPCWAATAAADPVDIDVDVRIDAPLAHRYLAVTRATGPKEDSFRVELDLAQGPTRNMSGGQLYSMFGAALARTTASPFNFATDDHLALRDDAALGYAAIGARVGRLDARW